MQGDCSDLTWQKVDIKIKLMLVILILHLCRLPGGTNGLDMVLVSTNL